MSICNKPASSSKLASEKIAVLPERNRKILVVDSSGEKHTSFMDTSEGAHIDFRKVMKIEENGFKTFHKETLYSEGNQQNTEGSENSEDELDKFSLKCLCGLSPPLSDMSAKSTQTEDMEFPILSEDQQLIGPCNSLSEEASPLPSTQTVLWAFVDTNEANGTALSLLNVHQGATGSDDQDPNDSPRYFSCQSEIIDDLYLTQHITTQSFEVVESRQSETGNGPFALREIEKPNSKLNPKRYVSLILLFVVFFWLCNFVFGKAFPWLILWKEHKKEQTKVQYLFMHIRKFIRFFGNIF